MGIAISDLSQLFARPFETVPAAELTTFLKGLFAREEIAGIVVGHPKTMGGVKSAQTIATEAWFERLSVTFPDYEWVLWDERLSSQRAAQGRKATTKAEKLRQHAIAAAFILELYLIYRSQRVI